MDDIWTNNLNETVDSIKNNDNIYNTGKVIKVNDYNIEVTGLNDVAFYEEVNVSDKATGYVFGIYADRVIVALVKINEEIKPGDMVYALKKESLEGKELKIIFQNFVSNFFIVRLY